MWICSYCETENPEESFSCACCGKTRVIRPAAAVSEARDDVAAALENVKRTPATAAIVLTLLLLAAIIAVSVLLLAGSGGTHYFASVSGSLRESGLLAAHSTETADLHLLLTGAADASAPFGDLSCCIRL